MTRGEELGAAERHLLDYLHTHWDQLFRLTTVAQAEAALGLPGDPERRWRLARYWRAQPATHAAVSRWGAPAFLLTEDEKLLGRYLLRQAGPSTECVTSAASAAAALGWPPQDLRPRLAALERAGLLAGSVAGDALRYSFATDWRQRLGPLGFTWHTVVRAGDERFNVP